MSKSKEMAAQDEASDVRDAGWAPRQFRRRSHRVKAKWTKHLAHSVGQEGSVSVEGAIATPHGFVLGFANTSLARCEIIIAGRKYCLEVCDDAGGLVNEFPRIAGEFAAECAVKARVAAIHAAVEADETDAPKHWAPLTPDEARLKDASSPTDNRGTENG